MRYEVHAESAVRRARFICRPWPTWFGRLARHGRVSVQRPVNEEYHAAGRIGSLSGHLDHYPFNKGFAEWIAKHNRYSTLEPRLFAERRDLLR